MCGEAAEGERHLASKFRIAISMKITVEIARDATLQRRVRG